MGFFLACIILGIDAIFGVFNLRSQVITAGVFTFIVCSPVSTYLMTYMSLPFISILEAKVACGQSSSPANI